MDRFAMDRLFIAIPDLSFRVKWVEQLRLMGYLSEEQHASILQYRKLHRKGNKVHDALSSGSIIDRLVAVAPEIVNEELVDLLAGVKWKQKRRIIKDAFDFERVYYKPMALISTTQAHGLRLALRTLTAASRGGLPTDRDQVFSRLARVMGVQFSATRVDLWRSAGWIDDKTAARWKGYLLTGQAVQESLAKARRAKSLLDALLVLGTLPASPQLVRGLVKTGVLTRGQGDTYLSLIALGVKEWKVFSGARAAEGWRRRAMLVLTGSMNAQLLDTLLTSGVISRQQYQNMQVMEILARRVNQRMLEDLTRRRYRVKPGEPPIRTFARASRVTDQELLSLLSTAARESAKEAEQLAELDKKGAGVRSAQYRLAAASLHQAMRNMWDGVGYMTIWGEKQAAEAAAESMDMLNKRVLKGLPPDLQRSMLWQAQTGIDSYISRQENTLNLSRLVYKNMALYQGKVDQRISLSLLRGQSAAEIALLVKKFISPSTPGGASYAAMRLARTEINNSFHYSSIRFTREQPWVRGYKWNKSRSHGHTDICDTMAGRDHDGLGEGVYKKANVPGKPHPQCLCFLTPVVMDQNEFVRAYRAGRFKPYMKQISDGDLYSAGKSSDFGAYARTGAGSVFS